MNVVFLLLTSAVTAAEQPERLAAPAAPPTTPPAATAPAHAAPIVSGCSGGCGTISGGCAADCCDKPGLFDRLRARFSRKSDCCQPSCPQPCCKPVVVHVPCQPATCCSAAPSCCNPCDKPSLFDRLRARFSRKDDCCAPSCCTSGCGSHGTIISAPAGPVGGATGERLRMPKVEEPQKPGTGGTGGSSGGTGGSGAGTQGQTRAPAPLLAPPSRKIETEAKHPFDSGRRHEQRYSRAADYSRLTGRLYFVHADGGLWLLRYAPLSEEGANGGSVILTRDRRLDSYREGDIITVEGRIIRERATQRLGGALYQVNSIRLVNRDPNPNLTD